MFKKILVAAGLVAALSLSSQAAEAKVNITIGIGDRGGYCYYNYDPFRCGPYGYYPRPGYFVPHPVYRDRIYSDRISCGEARWDLRDRGFRQIAATDCRGRTYVFIAKKRGGTFRIRFNSYNGSISVRPI
ncbi:MAG: hypothetical protein WCE69_13135 [Aestuariivirga sp.]